MKKIHYGWWIVLACCAIACCPGIIMMAAANFYSPVANELGIGIGTLTIYVTIMTLTMAVLQPLVGLVLEKHLKVFLFLGGVLQYSSMALMSTFQNVYQFWVAGFFIGVGGSVTMVMAIPILINMWFEKSRGLALGISYSFTGISGAIASMLAGHGISVWGWRTSYLLVALCGLLIYVPAILFLIKKPQQKGVLPYGADTIEKKQELRLPEYNKGMTFSLAVKSPIFYIMKISTVALAMVTSESSQVAAFSTEHFGLTIELAASAVAICGMGNMLGNIIMGMIDDKIGHTKTLLLAMMVIIFAQIAFLNAKDVSLLLMPAIFAIGFMFTIYNVVLPGIATSVFGNKDFSRIWAYIMSAGNVAGAVAIPLYGTAYDFTGAYTGVFLFTIVQSIICMITSLYVLNKAEC